MDPFRKRPENLNRSELRKFKHKALRMTVRERHLFTLPSGGRPLRRVVDDPGQQREIIENCTTTRGIEAKKVHGAKFGHAITGKGNMNKLRKALWPTEPPSILFGWITIDVVHMPPGLNGRKYLIVARDYASGWPEAKALAKNDSKAVQKFLINDVFSRWGLPLKMSADGGPENKGLVENPAAMGHQQSHFECLSSARARPNRARPYSHSSGTEEASGNWVDNLANALGRPNDCQTIYAGDTSVLGIGPGTYPPSGAFNPYVANIAMVRSQRYPDTACDEGSAIPKKG
ncbi:hypothetical protein P3342_012130 [Pyrenophora teres f. teres]|nr:hypothetical protein P3342_012130 [Pyrenophora teres f. teres]